MRNTIITYLAILAGVFAVFSLLDRKGDYVIEKKLWKIHREYADMTKDPSVIPDYKFNEIADRYQKIINNYPNSRLVKGIYILIGRIHMIKEDYETAREKYNIIIEKYPGNQLPIILRQLVANGQIDGFKRCIRQINAVGKQVAIHHDAAIAIQR